MYKLKIFDKYLQSKLRDSNFRMMKANFKPFHFIIHSEEGLYFLKAISGFISYTFADISNLLPFFDVLHFQLQMSIVFIKEALSQKNVYRVPQFLKLY